MNTRFNACLVVAGAFLVAEHGPIASAFAEGALSPLNTEGTVTEETKAAPSLNNARLVRLLKEASLSPGVSDVAKMANAGTDAELLTVHVLNSVTPYKLRPEDIAYLQDQAVPDSVIKVMIERGAELRAQMPPLPPPAPSVPVSTVTYVAAPQDRVANPRSTVTVIGSSYGSLKSRYYRPYYYSSGVYYSYGSYARYRPYRPNYSVYGTYCGVSRGYRCWR